MRTVLGADVGPHEPLVAAGLDSLGATELRNALQRVTGVALPATLVFDHPTVAALTVHIATLLAPLGERPEVAAHRLVLPLVRSLTSARAAAAEPLVVTASDMRLPGSSSASLTGVDASAVVPLQRWDVEALTATEEDAVR